MIGFAEVSRRSRSGQPAPMSVQEKATHCTWKEPRFVRVSCWSASGPVATRIWPDSALHQTATRPERDMASFGSHRAPNGSGKIPPAALSETSARPSMDHTEATHRCCSLHGLVRVCAWSRKGLLRNQMQTSTSPPRAPDPSSECQLVPNCSLSGAPVAARFLSGAPVAARFEAHNSLAEPAHRDPARRGAPSWVGSSGAGFLGERAARWTRKSQQMAELARSSV